MKFIILAVIAIAVLSGFLFWRYYTGGTVSTPNKPVTLTVWGLFEDENLVKPAIEAYKAVNPNVTVNYVFQSSLNYRSRVQTQIGEGQGPDVFIIHNTWLPMFLKTNSIAPMPETLMGMSEYQTIFYPVAKDSLTKDNKIYGIPRGIDGLALYYNEDILKAANVLVPKTWSEFRDAAIKTTVMDSKGKIKTAGAAIGTTGNVDHFSDILGLLMMQQPGVDPGQPDSANAAEVVKFYTDFVIDPTRKVWDNTMEPSTQAFAGGRLAFYFAPSWRAHELRVANPQLQFKTAPVPQLPGRNVGWATFWAYTVSAKSPAQKEAWEFVKFLSAAETEKLLYQEAAKVRLFGLPYSRVDLQKEVSADPIVGSFVNQAPSYKYWYLASKTQDQGLNDEMIKYFEDGINAVVLQGQSPQIALQTVAKGVSQVLEKYVAPSSAPK